MESSIEPLSNQFGIQSEVVAPRHRGERPDDAVVNGARVYSIDLFPFVAAEDLAGSFAKLFSSVRRAIASSNPSLVHLHAFSPLALAAFSAANTLQIPLVAHVHGELDPGLPPHYFKVLSEADSLVAVSHAVAKSIDRFVPNRRGSVEVVPNGVKDSLRNDFQPSSPVILCVGRLEPEKGFSDVISAFPEILRTIPDARLRIVGSGIELYALQVEAEIAGVAESVTFLGEISHGEVLSQIADSALVIVPSRKIEGFSLIAAEAAATGRPVVATRVGGLVETVVHEETGLLVSPNNPAEIALAAIQLLTEPTLYEAISQRARERARIEFSIDKFVSRLSDVYYATVSEAESARLR